MRENKVRKINCLAAVRTEAKPTKEAFKAANLLKLDSCALDRGKKILRKSRYRKLQIHAYDRRRLCKRANTCY